jgi:hypothetical protein
MKQRSCFIYNVMFSFLMRKTKLIFYLFIFYFSVNVENQTILPNFF